MIDCATFGQRIKYFREQLGITQIQLADSLHITQKTVSKYETGKSFPQVDMLDSIASVLQISVSDLLFDSFKWGTYWIGYDCTTEYIHSMKILKQKVSEDEVYRIAYDIAKLKFKQHNGKFVYKKNLTESEAERFRSFRNRFHNSVFDYFTKVDFQNIRYMTCMKGELTLAMMRVYGWQHPYLKDANNPYYQFSDSIIHPSLVISC